MLYDQPSNGGSVRGGTTVANDSHALFAKNLFPENHNLMSFPSYFSNLKICSALEPCDLLCNSSSIIPGKNYAKLG